MSRIIGMMACFALVGLNIFLIVAHHGGVFNYVSAAACLGSGLYVMSSLVRNP